MPSDPNLPRTGIAVIVLHGQRVLLGKRCKSPEPGSWQLPGGWLNYREQPEQAVARKIAEFPRMACSAPGFVGYTNNLFEGGLHSLSLYFQINCLNAERIDLGLNKHCSDWFWADWYDLPNPLFLPLSQLKKSGYVPFGGKK